MSKRAFTTEEITAIAVAAAVEAVNAALSADAPAVPQPKADRPKAKRQPKATPKATKVRHLTRGNRKEFVKAHAWAKGLSTQVIAAMAVEDPSLLKRGWAIGEGYRAMFA